MATETTDDAQEKNEAEQGAKDFNALIRGAVTPPPPEGEATPPGETKPGASMNALIRAGRGQADKD